MTSLLHLVMQFKPIKSTPMQFHLLFSPPSNAFLHLPCSSACPAPPQAGHPNTQHFYGGFFVQLSLPWHQQEHMLWARPPCILESSQICPSSLHTTCSHVQPLPIPPRAHSGGVAAQVLLGQFLAGSRNHHSHSNLLLQSPSRIPHATPPGTPKHSSVTLGKTTSIWASSHWPIVLNPYLNSHFKPATAEPTALPPLERACRCYITTSSKGTTGARVQNQLSALETQMIQRNSSNMKNGSGGNTRGNIEGCN